MARLNLTIPDSLYERLERLRDRVNVSKVCAIALSKELDMLEGSFTPTAHPKAARMIERLQQIKAYQARWYQHGYEDGEDWAAEQAEPREIRHILNEWDLDDGERYRFQDVEFPHSFDQRGAIRRWLDLEAQEGRPEDLPTRARDSGSMRDVDQDAYVKGWYNAVKDIWKLARPSLKWVEEEEDDD